MLIERSDAAPGRIGGKSERPIRAPHPSRDGARKSLGRGPAPGGFMRAFGNRFIRQRESIDLRLSSRGARTLSRDVPAVGGGRFWAGKRAMVATWRRKPGRNGEPALLWDFSGFNSVHGAGLPGDLVRRCGVNRVGALSREQQSDLDASDRRARRPARAKSAFMPRTIEATARDRAGAAFSA